MGTIEITAGGMLRDRPEWLARGLFAPEGAGTAWTLERLEEPLAVAAFAAWAGDHGSGVPDPLHRFLATLDLRCRELAPDRYRGRTWLGGAGDAVPHYGFVYRLETGAGRSARFLGFAREGGAVDLRLSAPWAPGEPSVRFGVYPLEATAIAHVLLALE